MENQPNIKIPLELVKQFKLSDTQLIIYGELIGIWNKYGKSNCHISNATLATRLNKSEPTIVKAIKGLKDENIISSKQIPSRRGRFIYPLTEFKPTPFLLIPTGLYKHLDVNLRDAIVYGYLASKYKQQQKIAIDSYQSDDILLTIKTKDIVKDLNKNSRTIRRALKSLAENQLIELYPLQSIGYEFRITDKKIPTDTKKKRANITNLNQNKKVKTPNLEKEEDKYYHPKRTNITNLNQKKWTNITTTSGQILPSNRYLIESNKNKKYEYSPFGEQNCTASPEPPKIVNNKLAEKSEKNGLYIKKENKRKPLIYKPYNLDKLLKEIIKHLNAVTGKNYSLASTRAILATRIMQGYTLNDFKEYIEVNKQNCNQASTFFSTPFTKYFQNK